MQDTKLFETILEITAPWHVARVELKPDEKRVDLWLEHDPMRWPVRSAAPVAALRSCGEGEPGGIWTRASFRRICMRRSLGFSARRMALNRCACHGPSPGVGSRC